MLSSGRQRNVCDYDQIAILAGGGMTAATAGLTVDRAEIARAIDILHEPDAVIELRALDVSGPGGRKPHIASGYFDSDHRDALVNAAANLSPHAAGVYVVANLVDADLLARAANRIEHGPEATTSGGNIKRRRWLLLDLDPVRPTGISATDAEHEASHQLAQELCAELRDTGWPMPVAMSSGNGFWLLYRVDLPNDDASKTLIEHVLLALALRCGGNVGVDKSLKDANRLVRLPGTLNRKGDDIPARPHRLARLLHVPEPLEVVPRALLEGLSARIPREILEPSQRRNGSAGHFDLAEWVRTHLPDAGDGHAWQGSGWVWAW